MPKTVKFANLKEGDVFMLYSDIDEHDEAPFFIKTDEVVATCLSNGHTINVSPNDGVVLVKMTFIAEY